MTPLIFGLGTTELLIILAVVLLLFGGTRLAGLGKSSGRAIREFKEETKGLNEPGAHPADPKAQQLPPGGATTPGGQQYGQNPPAQNEYGQAQPGQNPAAQQYPPAGGATENPAAPDRHPDDLR